VLDALWPVALLQAKRWTLLTDDPAAYAHAQSKLFADRLLLDMPASVATPASDLADTQLAALIGKAAELASQGDASNALWMHSRGMVGPWDAPVELRNQYADEEDPTPPTFTAPPEQMLPDDYDPDLLLGIAHAYAGQVSLLDACLGVLLDTLDEHPRKASLEFMLVGMRGYPLGEHHRVGLCDAPLYRELVHVPLMIYRPGSAAKVGRSGRLLTHADVPSLLLGERPVGPERDHLLFTSQHDRAIRTPAWCLRESGTLDHPRRELYVKPDDLWEVNDVADRCPEIVAGLAEALAHPDSIATPLAEPLVTSAGE
jgi:hypothetical protein